jgi:putative heme-binding domain-containing protein
VGGWGKPHGVERKFDPKASAPAPGGGKAAWRKAEAGPDGAFELPLEAASKVTSSYLHMRLESPAGQSVQLVFDATAPAIITLNGSVIHSTEAATPPGGVTVATALKQGGNDLWARVRGGSSPGRLSLRTRALDTIVVDLPEPLTGMTLAERLAANGGTPVDPAALLKLDWKAEAASGNPRRGKRLFAAEGLGCAKCHAMSVDAAGNAGPSLAAAGRRFSVDHIVESVLTPSKTIAPIFKATTVVTNDGRTQTGLVVGETAEAIELLLADASTVKIALADVDERVPQDVSPMPAGLVQNAAEMRDLLAYLMQAD